MPSSPKIIDVGLRGSPLSIAQMHELLIELRQYEPKIEFRPHFIKTRGDVDKQTSLRAMVRCDFFTREIDEELLTGNIDMAIHSAKDLPEPLLDGLCVAYLSKGQDPSDSLVLRSNDTLATLQDNAVIATSSPRREESVRLLLPKANFVDIRGTIQERLEVLFSGKIDGLVVATAALIRLKLMHLNRITLPGETAPLQGKIAVVVRKSDLTACCKSLSAIPHVFHDHGSN